MIPYFDAHCDTVSRLTYNSDSHFDQNTNQWDLNKMNLFNPCAQFFALFFNSERPGYQKAVEEQLHTFRREITRCKDRMALCRNSQEIKKANNEHKVAALLSIEGAELIDCSIDRLRWAHEQGVRAVNLTWNHANLISGSNVEDVSRGLSEQGILFVKEMEHLGMIADVSHLSDAGFWDLIEMSKNPIMASHSNSRNAHFHSRNLTDNQFVAIIKKRGIVGLNCYSAFIGTHDVSFDTLRKHLDHFLDLGGAKNIALGGDWDGCDQLPKEMKGNWDWAAFYEYLLEKNYPESILQDIYFNNLMRIVSEVCIT